MREDKRPAGAPCQPRSGPAHRKTLQAHETPHLNPKTEKQQLYYQRILETAFLNVDEKHRIVCLLKSAQSFK